MNNPYARRRLILSLAGPIGAATFVASVAFLYLTTGALPAWGSMPLAVAVPAFAAGIALGVGTAILRYRLPPAPAAATLA